LPEVPALYLKISLSLLLVVFEMDKALWVSNMAYALADLSCDPRVRENIHELATHFLEERIPRFIEEMKAIGVRDEDLYDVIKYTGVLANDLYKRDIDGVGQTLVNLGYTIKELKIKCKRKKNFSSKA